MSKILSGRFLLTVICGLVFAYVSINKVIPPDATIAILTLVFMAYFSKSRDGQNGKGDKNV